MELRDCYERLGGSYEEALGRLMNEKLMQRFLLKFLNDGSFALLEESLAAQNWEESFRAAHTLKGVCGNLAFTALCGSSGELTEALRNGWTEPVPQLARRVEEDYDRTVRAIREYQDEL